MLSVGPDLSGGYALYAPAEQAEMRVGDAEDAAGSGAEGADYQGPIVGLNQENFGNCRVGKMDAAHGGHLIGDADGMIEREHYYFGGSGCDGVKDRGYVDGAGGDAELGASAQGAGEELRLHAVGVGDEDGDGGGRGQVH